MGARIPELLDEQIVDFAGRMHATIRKAVYPCEIASLPGDCRAYVLAASPRMWLEVIGTVDMNGLLVDCFTRPGGAKVMTPVCADVIRPR